MDIFPFTHLMTPVLSLLLSCSLVNMVVYAGKINLHKNCTNLYFLSLTCKNQDSLNMLLVLKDRFYTFQGLAIDRRNREQLKPLRKVRENKVK